MTASLRQKLTGIYAYILLLIYGIVIEGYTFYLDFTVEMDYSVSLYNNTFGNIAIYIIIAGIILPIFKIRPGSKVGSCMATIAIFLILSPIFAFMWLLFLIYPPLLGSSVVTPYMNNAISLIILIVAIPIQILVFRQGFGGEKFEFGLRKFKKKIFKAEGKTVEEYHQVVISILESTEDFELTDDKSKGFVKDKFLIQGLYGGLENRDRVGVTVSLSGKKDQKKFDVRIEMSSLSKEQLEFRYDEVTTKLGFS